MRIKEQLKDIFYFNKKERNGFIILIILIGLVFIINNTLFLFIKPEKVDYSEFENQIAEFKATLVPKDDEEYLDRLDKFIVDMYDTLELFEFNPNIATSDQLAKLGLTDKQIKTITNYRERGGKFYSKDDFRKMYGIRQKQYEILESYINLPGESEVSNSENYFAENEVDSSFTFDPNSASDSIWELFGLKEKQIATINKYISKGGKFTKKEDLLKIYGLEQETYEKLEQHLNFESDDKSVTETQETETEVVSIEINSATLEQLSELKNIGDYYAGKIVKFRDLLGGFYDKTQILEIYGFKQEIYDKIKDNIYVDETSVQKIRLNFAEFDEINAHPCIDYETTKAIVTYRSKNGSFTKIEQLLKIEGITEEIYNKIKNYLTVE